MRPNLSEPLQQSRISRELQSIVLSEMGDSQVSSFEKNGQNEGSDDLTIPHAGQALKRPDTTFSIHTVVFFCYMRTQADLDSPCIDYWLKNQYCLHMGSQRWTLQNKMTCTIIKVQTENMLKLTKSDKTPGLNSFSYFLLGTHFRSIHCHNSM